MLRSGNKITWPASVLAGFIALVTAVEFKLLGSKD